MFYKYNKRLSLFDLSGSGRSPKIFRQKEKGDAFLSIEIRLDNDIKICIQLLDGITKNVRTDLSEDEGAKGSVLITPRELHRRQKFRSVW
jgi:hypothetical protein